MNPRDPNVQLVELVTKQLDTLAEKLVLVGGCTTGLLITDPARPPARATTDVDLIVEALSLTGYYELENELRRRGFAEDGEVTCRWRLGALKVDVMPTDGRILGFTNRWYQRAVEQARQHTLPSGARINVISPPLFVATKMEAFHDRGNGEYGVSHDMEDIVTVVDGRQELVGEILHADGDIKLYLEEEVDDLLAKPEFTSTLSYHLPGDSANQQRASIILERLRQIAGL